jgi:hypothetical protein
VNKLKIDFTFNNKQYKLSVDAGDKITQKYLESQMSLCGRYELDVRPIDLLCTYRQYLSLPTLHPLNADELQEAQAKEKIYNVITLENSCSVDEWFFESLQDDILTLLFISDTTAQKIAEQFKNTRIATANNDEANIPYQTFRISDIFESAEFRKLFTAFNIYIEQNK